VSALTIAHVTPYAWEGGHEVNVSVARLADELRARGHRVLVVAPSRDGEQVRRGRALVRAARRDPGALLDAGVVAVGEVLPELPGATRRRAPGLPVDVARTVEELLTALALDVVHVHEPFAPSTASAALRHSRALNVGTFHLPAERVVSTQVARRLVELVYGRLDARLAAFGATADVMRRAFPADYRVVLPGADAAPHAEPRDGRVRVGIVEEERAAARLVERALRRAPDGWRRVAPERADVLVAASAGAAPAPGAILRGVARGAVPLVSRLPVYEELAGEGERGLLFEPGDAETLAAQFARLVGDGALRARLRDGAGPLREEVAWDRVTDAHEEIYEGLAARRHPLGGRPDVRRRIAGRPRIDVDLHMHTDHSHDCATPVEVLLDTARQQGLGAIAVTDHNEVSGALEAAEQAEAFGVKVIVGEEVKTASQGEVIGLFLEEKIPRGLTLQETVGEIKRQGGVVYVPHPFDRMHSVPDYEHLRAILDDVDVLEIYNPRVAIGSFNEEAERFAAKYRVLAAAGSDSHVAQGLGSVRVRMPDFDGPEEFLEALRDAEILRGPSSLLYVQALKFLETKATPPAARGAVRRRRVRRARRKA